MLAHFWDNKEGGFFFTSDYHEKLIIRTKNFYDLAIPSGNSVAALALLRLFHYTQTDRYYDAAQRIMNSSARAAAENPFGFGQLLFCVYLNVKKPLEVVVLSRTRSSSMQKWLFTSFLPEVLLALPTEKDALSLQAFQFFKNRSALGTETAYVCRNFSCSLPLDSLEKLQKHIAATEP